MIYFIILASQKKVNKDMTKKLEQTFDLESMKEIEKRNEETETVNESEEQEVEENHTEVQKFDKIDNALPAVKHLEAGDKEMDEIANTATESFKDLMDLGYNVEQRYSAEIFGAAIKLLDTALTAKIGKSDKNLKMVQLQLQKAKLDQAEEKQSNKLINEQGDTVKIRRNDLVDRLLVKDDEKKEIDGQLENIDDVDNSQTKDK